MKKYLTVLFVAMMMVILPANIFAEEGMNEVTDDSATVELEAIKASSYKVKLPKKVDVSETSKTFNVFTAGDIAASEELVISYDSTSTIYLQDVVSGSDKANVALGINAADGTFHSDDLNVDYGDAKAVFTITHGALQAGKYAAVLPVTITLQNKTA